MDMIEFKHQVINQIADMLRFMENGDDVTDYRDISISNEDNISLLSAEWQQQIKTDLSNNYDVGFCILTKTCFYYNGSTSETFPEFLLEASPVELLIFLRNKILERCKYVILERTQELEYARSIVKQIQEESLGFL